MFCPKCGKKVPEGARFCDECGAQIPASAGNKAERDNTADVSSGQSQPAQQPQSAVIPQQPKSVQPLQSKPQSAQLYQAQMPQQSPTKKSGSKIPLIIGIVIAVVIVVIAATMLFGGSSGSSNVYMGILGEDFPFTDIEEMSNGTSFTFDSRFWNIRNDKYKYHFGIPAADAVGMTSGVLFFIKDNTDNKALSVVDDASYQDDIWFRMTGSLDKKDVTTSEDKSGNPVTYYYVTVTDAYELYSDSDDVMAELNAETDASLLTNSETETESDLLNPITTTVAEVSNPEGAAVEDQAYMEYVKNYLSDFNEIRAADVDEFTDGELLDIYNELMDRIARVDVYGIGIDGMRSILSNSELKIMSEQTAESLYDNEILDLYEELCKHENDTDGTWFAEMRERYGLTSGDDDYVLPDSDSRYYTASELSGLTKDELRIARNEIYARHGRIFDSADLDEYFRSKSWYNPTIPASQFTDSMLNDYEKKNAALIRSVE